jgi:hypothetical protein
MTKHVIRRTPMNHREFRDATAKLRAGGVDLEECLRAKSATIARWESGEASVPEVRARQIRWLLQAEDNRQKRKVAGLIDCDWLERHHAGFAALAKPSLEQAEIFSEDLEEHLATCPTCLGNEAWAKANLPALGAFPMAGFRGYVAGILSRTPRSFFPALIGALMLGGVVLLRMLGALAWAIIRGTDAGTILTLLGTGIVSSAAAAAAGASGGLALSIVRPWLRPLGAPGDYLTGILVVWAYAFSIGFLAQFVFDEPVLEDNYAVFALIWGGILGAVGAFSHRRGEAKKAEIRSGGS